MPAPGGSPSGVRGADAVATVLLRLDEGLLGSVAEPDRRRRADWANSFVDVLERLYGRRALDSGRRSDRTLARALSAVAVACRSLADLPPELDGDVSAASALRDALRLAAGGRIGAEPESDAIEALGWLELHPDDAPLKILTGANEPFLPEAVRGDPFLPDALRGMLGLVDDRTRLARDVYRLQAMARSTPCLVVVAGRRTDQNDPLRPSRLLFAAEPDTVVERVHRFFDATRADAVSDADAGEDGGPSPSRRGSAGGGFSVPPVPRLHAERILDRVRVTDFSRLLADPYRFALLREVAGDSVRDDARELDPMQFGNVVHEVLDELGKEDTIHSADVDVLVERLDSLLYTSYQRRYRSGAQVPHVSVRIQREQIRSRLHAFAAWHAGRVEEGWEVVGTEVGTQEGGIPLDVDGRSIRVTGKIDRIERHAETGAYAVFDYKTAGTFKTPEQHHRTRGRWVDLQLPLYRWMLPRLRDDEGATRFPDAVDVPIAVGFVNLCRTLSKIGSVEAAWSDEEHADALETARAAVRDMRGEGFGWDPSRTPPYPNDEVERILGKGVLVPIETGDDA